MKLATAAQMKEMDRIAIEERGIASTLLMERAARALVRETMALVEEKTQPRTDVTWFTKDGAAPAAEEQAAFWEAHKRSVILFCGAGNNGGDGVAAACFFLQAGWRVRCVLVGEREWMTADCREMERRLIACGGALEPFDAARWQEYTGYTIAVDALFGIGLSRPLDERAQCAVRAMQRAQWIVAADIPSGVQADTGVVQGCAVAADVTVTFSMGKPGLFVGKGALHSGRVVVADIGIPEDLMADVCAAAVMEQPRLKKRARDAHKGDFGKLFILAGSRGYTGAPVLASHAAVRSGTGLVTLAVPEDIYPIVAVKCREEMPWPLEEGCDAVLEKASGCDAVLIGPGLGQGARAEALVLFLFEHLSCPVILDADGLNILARHIDVLDRRKALTVLTPHDGEFARLSGCALPIENRLAAARAFAQRHGCILVLKGHRTIIAAPDGMCVINTTGNPGMAKGGSGDALAGMIGALLVQQKQADAVAEAVWLHGRAGDLAAADKGEYGMTVSDLIEQIPYAMKECEEG